MSVAIIGTVALDSIKTPKGIHERILGGSATYAGTAARLFAPVSLISIVGKDFPAEHVNYFKSRDINIDGVKIADGKTFHWSGYYEGDMSQAHTISTDLNVLLEFDPQIPPSAKKASIVFLANTDPILQEKAIAQFESPKLIVMDTMNFWIQSKLEDLKKTLKLVDVLIINDQELRLLTGISNIIQAMPKVIEMGPKRVIIKKGEHGAIMFNGKNHFICPAFPLEDLVDPTGAGDSFAGGFCGYLAKAGKQDEATFRQAVVAGTLISSYTVQGFSLDELKKVQPKTLADSYHRFKEFIQLPDAI